MTIKKCEDAPNQVVKKYFLCSIETESRIVVVWAQGPEKGIISSGNKRSLGGDEYVLKLGCANDCITMLVY